MFWTLLWLSLDCDCCLKIVTVGWAQTIYIRISVLRTLIENKYIFLLDIMFRWNAVDLFYMPLCSIYIIVRLRGYETEWNLNIHVLAQRLILFCSFSFDLVTFEHRNCLYVTRSLYFCISYVAIIDVEYVGGKKLYF